MRAYGADFEVDAFLASSPLAASNVFRKGEPRRSSDPGGPQREKSGVCIGVSDAEWSDLSAQIREAEQFLVSNRAALESLAAIPGIEHFILDFPIELRADGIRIGAQTDVFPASLVLLAAAFGLGLALTIYN